MISISCPKHPRNGQYSNLMEAGFVSGIAVCGCLLPSGSARVVITRPLSMYARLWFAVPGYLCVWLQEPFLQCQPRIHEIMALSTSGQKHLLSPKKKGLPDVSLNSPERLKRHFELQQRLEIWTLLQENATQMRGVTRQNPHFRPFIDLNKHTGRNSAGASQKAGSLCMA